VSGAGEGAVEPRTYRMVRFLEGEIDKRKLDRPRVMNLAALLQRNGLLQVAVFLQAKGLDKSGKQTSDGRLRSLLEEAIHTVVGDFPNRDGTHFGLDAKYLSGLDMDQALLLEEFAVEAAAWIRRLHEAKVESGGGEPKAAGKRQ
jgi:hypothetical protein